jgi:L-lactate dehydrogenase complex protein LldG
MTNTRETIFQSIKSALSPLPHRTERPEVPHGVADAAWLADEDDNLALFLKRAEATGSKVFTDPQVCADWLSTYQPGIVYVPNEFQEYIPLFSKYFQITTIYTRKETNTVNACFTAAAAGIAESGTIILTDEYTPDRLAALAPWYHIAILRRSQIHRSIADALAAMPDDPNIIWATGPSKTADVEGILIQGVHGPGVQACLIL